MSFRDQKDEPLIPTWDGEVAGWAEYSRRVRLCWAQTPSHKRYTLGPKLVLRLKGKAWEVASTVDHSQLEKTSGTPYLLKFLKAKLGRLPVPDVGQHLDELFAKSRRPVGMDLLSWCNQLRENYRRVQRALARTMTTKLEKGTQTDPTGTSPSTRTGSEPQRERPSPHPSAAAPVESGEPAGDTELDDEDGWSSPHSSTRSWRNDWWWNDWWIHGNWDWRSPSQYGSEYGYEEEPAVEWDEEDTRNFWVEKEDGAWGLVVNDLDDFETLTDDMVHWLTEDELAETFQVQSEPDESEAAWFSDGHYDWTWTDGDWMAYTTDGWVAYSDMKPWMDIDEVMLSDHALGKELHDLYVNFDQKVRSFKEAREAMHQKGKSRGYYPIHKGPIHYVATADEDSDTFDVVYMVEDETDSPPPTVPTVDLQRMILTANESDTTLDRMRFAVLDTGATETVGSLEAIEHIMSVMDQFQETLKLDLLDEEREKIGKAMVTETSSKKTNSKKGIDLSKYDWGRVEFTNPRDPRAVKGPCEGHHSVQPFGRGSLSGMNGHGVWLTCEWCALRVLYCPTYGAKATHRSAGPLSSDVKSKLNEMTDGEVTQNQLTTQALGLDAAEASALKKVEEIRRQKEQNLQKKGKGASKGKTKTQSPSTPTEPGHTSAIPPKKEVKRRNSVPAEVQEKSGDLATESTPSEEWSHVHQISELEIAMFPKYGRVATDEWGEMILTEYVPLWGLRNSDIPFTAVYIGLQDGLPLNWTNPKPGTVSKLEFKKLFPKFDYVLHVVGECQGIDECKDAVDLMPNETIQAQAISEWNPLAKKQLPLCQWLENHQGPEEQSRLKADHDSDSFEILDDDEECIVIVDPKSKEEVAFKLRMVVQKELTEFRGDEAAIAEVVKVRMELQSLDLHDADAKVVSMLRASHGTEMEDKRRSLARLPADFEGNAHVCLILDGMDRSKFKVPRSTSVISSKDFSAFGRPTLDCYGCLNHGRMAILFQTLPHIRKDSNFSCEVIAYNMHKLAEVADTRRMELVCQSDNCCREVKNNSVVRLLGLWVGCHSHEDIDALFGALTYHLEREFELHTDAAFLASLQTFLSDPLCRPNEPEKFALQVANELQLMYDNLPRKYLDKYRHERRNLHIYRAAAKFFAEGVPWETSLAIVKEAFDEWAGGLKMGAKRKSGDGAGKAGKALKIADGPKSSEFFKAFDDWSYCQPADLNKSGPAQLRPWQVPFSANCGLKGVACPDTWLRDRDLHCGFKTNADVLPGVEKLAISVQRADLGTCSTLYSTVTVISGKDNPMELVATNRGAAAQTLSRRYGVDAEDAKLKDDEEMVQKVQAMTLAHTEKKIQSDFAVYDAWLKLRQEWTQKQGLMDCKYLASRYAKGQHAVQEFMMQKHKYVSLDGGVSNAQADFIAFQSSVLGKESSQNVNQVTLVVIDATVMPGRAVAIDEACDFCKCMCNASAETAAFVFQPVIHQSTDRSAIIVAKRNLEDKLMALIIQLCCSNAEGEPSKTQDHVSAGFHAAKWMARAEMGTTIPWLLETDYQLLVIIDPSTSARSYKCLADAACDIEAARAEIEKKVSKADVQAMLVVQNENENLENPDEPGPELGEGEKEEFCEADQEIENVD
ncbi:Integrase catalytic domain-containing protein [Durusdinium trenchii]|uniref:Integrase catalytic domain-containing protein n=1 Tax=Durusdinium trenchii TaxID=1381693 RepID=A0ABP0M0Q9_9DINO